MFLDKTVLKQHAYNVPLTLNQIAWTTIHPGEDFKFPAPMPGYSPTFPFIIALKIYWSPSLILINTSTGEATELVRIKQTAAADGIDSFKIQHIKSVGWFTMEEIIIHFRAIEFRAELNKPVVSYYQLNLSPQFINYLRNRVGKMPSTKDEILE